MKDINIKIRNVSEKDSSLLRLLASLCPPLDVHTPYTYWVICKYFSKSCFVLEDTDKTGEEKAVAYITALETDDCVFVWQIAILETYRGRNLSKLLIDAVVKLAEEKGKKLQVTISMDNKPSYNSFKSYCEQYSYDFNKAGQVNLCDFVDVSFSESEIVYDIIKNR